VIPDRLDLRDRLYMPPVAVVPGLALDPKTTSLYSDQGQTNACTGFALASVVYHLQHTAKRKQKDCCVSPFMLYSMARRYDEFPGDPDIDTGSSLRGAIKGWYKHGACSDRLWTSETMPTGPSDKVRRRLVARCRTASARGILPASTRGGYRLCTFALGPSHCFRGPQPSEQAPCLYQPFYRAAQTRSGIDIWVAGEIHHSAVPSNTT